MPFPHALVSYCSGAAPGYIVKPGHNPGLVRIIESCQWNRPKFSFFLDQAKYPTCFKAYNIVLAAQKARSARRQSCGKSNHYSFFVVFPGVIFCPFPPAGWYCDQHIIKYLITSNKFAQMIVIVCYLIKQSRQHCQQKLPRLLCVLTGNFRTDYWCQLVLC